MVQHVPPPPPTCASRASVLSTSVSSEAVTVKEDQPAIDHTTSSRKVLGEINPGVKEHQMGLKAAPLIDQRARPGLTCFTCTWIKNVLDMHVIDVSPTSSYDIIKCNVSLSLGGY